MDCIRIVEESCVGVDVTRDDDLWDASVCEAEPKLVVDVEPSDSWTLWVAEELADDEIYETTVRDDEVCGVTVYGDGV